MAQIQKQYIYKVYKDSQYVGDLPNTTKEFSYSQDINTGGAQIEIQIAATMEKAGISVDIDRLADELGNLIVDESGNRIITRKDYEFANIPANLGNRLDVWLFDDNEPNGRRIFTGIITTWEADEEDANINVTAMSYGVQLDNYLVRQPPIGMVIDYISGSDTNDIFYATHFKSTTPYNRTTRVAQSFTVPSLTRLMAASFVMSKPRELRFDVYADVLICEGSPSGKLKEISRTGLLVDNVIPATRNCNFYQYGQVIELKPNTTYTFVIEANGWIDYALLIGRKSADPTGYPNGDAFTYNDASKAWTVAAGDYAFRVIGGTSSTAVVFFTKDPGEIMRTVMTNYLEDGGAVSFDETTVDNTGTVASYIFTNRTVLDAIQTILRLAPSRWYWYVDPGENKLHFHRQGSKPHHIFTRSKHVQNLKIRYTLDEMQNYVLFTGGDNGENTNTNVAASESDKVGIQKYGQWLGKDSDNRVTRQDTADLMVANTLSQRRQPRFSTEVTLIEGVYDIESIKLGDIVGFNNFNPLINDLKLQVVSLRRSATSVTLRLDTLPPTQTHRIEEIRRNLQRQEDLNNPT